MQTHPPVLVRAGPLPEGGLPKRDAPAATTAEGGKTAGKKTAKSQEGGAAVPPKDQPP